MPTKDPQKNREYVARHRAMKKATEEGKKEYNSLNLSYIVKHNNKKIDEIGKEQFKEDKKLYMREYRKNLKQKKEEEQKRNKASIMLQNAYRNKKAIDTFATKYAKKIVGEERKKSISTITDAIKARKARQEILKLKQEKANETMTQINNGRELNKKLSSFNFSYPQQMTNDLISNVINTVPIQKRRGRPPKNPN